TQLALVLFPYTTLFRSAKDADLVLFVVDSSIPLDENDREIMELLKGKKAIVILNKADLEQIVTEDELKGMTSHPVVSVSAKEERSEEHTSELQSRFDLV